MSWPADGDKVRSFTSLEFFVRRPDVLFGGGSEHDKSGWDGQSLGIRQPLERLIHTGDRLYCPSAKRRISKKNLFCLGAECGHPGHARKAFYRYLGGRRTLQLQSFHGRASLFHTEGRARSTE